MVEIACVICGRESAVEFRGLFLCGSCFVIETALHRTSQLPDFSVERHDGSCNHGLLTILARLVRDLEDLRSTITADRNARAGSAAPVNRSATRRNEGRSGGNGSGRGARAVGLRSG